ncbi:MAG: TIGR00730 family Rossman fold protein [Calditrichia bacterium]
MPKSICVFCASSNNINEIYIENARQVGETIAKRGDTLIYGGGSVGLMGVVARAVHAHGGKVVGVIPEVLNKVEVAYELSDELVVTRDMRERKAIMDDRSDAVITLPGGFGTLEELIEMITHKQLLYHDKPIVLMNINGFYNPLAELFDHFFRENFARDQYRGIYHLADTVADAFEYIDAYPVNSRK